MPDEAKQVLPARQYLLDSKLAASATAVSVPWLEIAAAAWKLCKGVLSINSAAHLSQHLHRQLRADFLRLHQHVQRLDQAIAEPGRPESLSKLLIEQCVKETRVLFRASMLT